MHQPNYLRGTFFYILASLLFTSVNALVKGLAKTYPLPEVLMARALVPLALFMLHAGFERRLSRIWPQSGWRVFHVSIAFMVSLAVMFYGFTVMPFAEMTIYMYTAPFFTVALMRFFEKEPITVQRILVLCIGFSGVALASSANGVTFDWIMMIGLAAGFLNAFSGVTMSRASRVERVESIIFWFHLLGALVLAALWFKTPLKPVAAFDVLKMIALGTLSYMGGLCLIASMRCASMAFLAPFSYLSFIMASIYGVFIFTEPLTTQLIIGAIIITLSGILNHKMGGKK